MATISFIGTGEWGVAILGAAIKSAVNIRGVITSAEYVPHFARICAPRNVPVKTFESWDKCAEIFTGIDLGLCAAWKKIPASILQLPRNGFVNVHGSLLPGYRGPEPLERQYLKGEKKIGVTIHAMTDTIDAGPILVQSETIADPSGSFKAYFFRLLMKGTRLVQDNIESIANGNVSPIPESSIEQSYYPFLKPSDAAIDWNDDVEYCVRKINCLGKRGWICLHNNGQRVHLLDAKIIEQNCSTTECKVVHDDGKIFVLEVKGYKIQIQYQIG